MAEDDIAQNSGKRRRSEMNQTIENPFVVGDVLIEQLHSKLQGSKKRNSLSEAESPDRRAKSWVPWAIK